MGALAPAWANSLAVTLLSSARMRSAPRNVSAARGLRSDRLPIGVATMYRPGGRDGSIGLETVHDIIPRSAASAARSDSRFDLQPASARRLPVTGPIAPFAWPNRRAAAGNQAFGCAPRAFNRGGWARRHVNQQCRPAGVARYRESDDQPQR